MTCTFPSSYDVFPYMPLMTFLNVDADDAVAMISLDDT